jgi:hypothetical protein
METLSMDEKTRQTFLPPLIKEDRDLLKDHIDRLLRIGGLMLLPEPESRDYTAIGAAIADALNDIPAIRKMIKR